MSGFDVRRGERGRRGGERGEGRGGRLGRDKSSTDAICPTTVCTGTRKVFQGLLGFVWPSYPSGERAAGEVPSDKKKKKNV